MIIQVTGLLLPRSKQIGHVRTYIEQVHQQPALLDVHKGFCWQTRGCLRRKSSIFVHCGVIVFISWSKQDEKFSRIEVKDS